MADKVTVASQLQTLSTTKENFRTNLNSLYQKSKNNSSLSIVDHEDDLDFSEWPSLLDTGLLKTTTLTAIPNSTNSPQIIYAGDSNSSGFYCVSVAPMQAGSYSSSVSNAVTGILTSSTNTGFSVTSTGTATINTNGYLSTGNKTSNATTYIQAASVLQSGSAAASLPTAIIGNDNIVLSGNILTTQPATGYYAALNATAPATTLTPTSTVVKGYLDLSTQITGSVSTTATSKEFFIPIQSAALSKSGKTVSVSTEGYAKNLSLNVDSGTATAVTPSISLNGLKITATAPAPTISSGWITSSESNSGTSGTSTISNLTIDGNISLTYSSGTVTASNLNASLIREGYTILGVTGTLSVDDFLGEDEINANVSAGYLLSGYYAYNESGNSVNGTMVNYSNSTLTTSNPSFTSGNVLEVTLDSTGYILGSNTKANITVPNASTISLNITDKASTNLTVGTLSSGYYPFSTSLTGTLTAGTPGYFSSGSYTDSSVIVGRLPDATYSTSLTGTETISLNPTLIRTSTAASGATNVGNSSATTTAPASGYFISMQSENKIGTTTVSSSANINSDGYIVTKSLGTNSKTITATAYPSSIYYIPLTAGVGTVSITDDDSLSFNNIFSTSSPT